MTTKQKIIANLKWSKKNKQPLGGQSCGTLNTEVVVICEELGIEIIVSHSRSVFGNKSIAMDLMKSSIDKLLNYETENN
jgi:protein subunit release factor A